MAWKDPSDRKTVNTMYVLAGINAFVIIQGFYTFNLRMKNDCSRMRNKIIAFYFMALTCLMVAEIYFLSYKLPNAQCSQSFLQTYPAFSYLIVGYTYVFKSLEVLNVYETSQT